MTTCQEFISSHELKVLIACYTKDANYKETLLFSPSGPTRHFVVQ